MVRDVCLRVALPQTPLDDEAFPVIADCCHELPRLDGVRAQEAELRQSDCGGVDEFKIKNLEPNSVFRRRRDDAAG